jgi:hypothetical protein
MMTRLASLALLLAFTGLAACGDEDLKFGDPSETATPGGATNTPEPDSTPTPTPTVTPTP